MTYHFGRMSPSDKFQHAVPLVNERVIIDPNGTEGSVVNGAVVFNSVENFRREVDEVTHDILSDASVLGKINGTTSISALHGIQGLDPNLFGKIIEARGYLVRDPVEADREPLFLLDMFRDRSLITTVDRGTSDLLWSDEEHNLDDVRFIADCAEDLPAHGGGMSKNWHSAAVKKFGNHCQVGICQVWEWGSQAPSMIDRMYDRAFMAHDYFMDYILHNGAPNHCVYGFIDHPDIDCVEVPPTKQKELCDPSKPATAWVNKTPLEILYDITSMLKMSRIKRCYTGEASDIVLADDLYCILTDTIATPEGRCLMELIRQKMTNADGRIRPLVSFNEAGAATEADPNGTPIVMTGDFNRDSIEVAVQPTLRLEQVTEAMCWKTPFISGISSVIIRRPNRFCKFVGM